MSTRGNEPPPLPGWKTTAFMHWWQRGLITVVAITAGVLLITPTAQAAVHTVVPGETLWNISWRYDTTVDQIKSLNNLEGDLLYPGQQLTVPDISPALAPTDSESSLAAAAAFPTATASAPENQAESLAVATQVRHLVQAGDTLYGIGLKYGLSVEAIMYANNLSSTLIHPGQSLLIPTVTVIPDTAPVDKGHNTSSRGGTRGGSSVVEIATQYENCPYRYGGSGPSSFDCSGFAAYVFAQVGEQLPHNAAAQYERGYSVAKSDLQPGDLVFFGLNGSASIQHVGIYVGNNKFIHASSGRGRVITSSLAENYYFNNYKGARRL
ncbi:MAG TPA: LysM peptidoglycan-binding domain-containing protein [Firmicutes bacterium]|jgi:peptidoglycan endopeptidase LytE|nr:LysM peptidoglycan-binding domain-containing protein [Bacillota bacterium]